MSELSKYQKEIDNLKRKIAKLKKENEQLKEKYVIVDTTKKTVSSPPMFEPIFKKAEQLVGSYFKKLKIDPLNKKYLLRFF